MTEEMDEDLFCVFVDKCEGEALTKVRSVNPGEGWQAYQRLFLWYGSSSGLALQERAKLVLSPKDPKKDDEVSGALNGWLEQLRIVEDQPYYVLSPLMKFIAVRMLMDNKKDVFEQAESRVQVDDTPTEQFNVVINYIREWANRRRLDATFKRKDDAMEVDEVNSAQLADYRHDCSSQDWSMGDLDALGKGKAQGKGWVKGGKKGGKGPVQCWTCGEWGHTSLNCPYVKSSKGTGKGGITFTTKGQKGSPRELTCWNCGGVGHPTSLCPSVKVKGGKGGKTGKYISELNNEDEYLDFGG